MLWVSRYLGCHRDIFVLYVRVSASFWYVFQLDKWWTIPCPWDDEWCGEHTEQKRGGEGQDRTSRRLLFAYLVYCLESLQVGPFVCYNIHLKNTSTFRGVYTQSVFLVICMWPADGSAWYASTEGGMILQIQFFITQWCLSQPNSKDLL